MAGMSLTKTRLVAGVWEGQLRGSGPGDGAGGPPRLRVTHLNAPLKSVEIMALPEAGLWLVRVAVPPDLLSDGVQTIVIADPETGETLASLSLIAGDALDSDIRAEVNLLRAELDMLKRAFRRHCVETA